MLAEHKELALESLRVESVIGGRSAIAVVVADDDKWLENGRLAALGSRAEDSVVNRDGAPSKNSETEVCGNLGKSRLLLFEGAGIGWIKEYVADSVLSRLWEYRGYVTFGLTLEESVGDARHDTGAVAVTSVCTSCASVGHRTEQLSRIRDQLVAWLAFDLAHEADTASIVLVVWIVKSLLRGPGAGPGVGIAGNRVVGCLVERVCRV